MTQVRPSADATQKLTQAMLEKARTILERKRLSADEKEYAAHLIGRVLELLHAALEQQREILDELQETE